MTKEYDKKNSKTRKSSNARKTEDALIAMYAMTIILADEELLNELVDEISSIEKTLLKEIKILQDKDKKES